MDERLQQEVVEKKSEKQRNKKLWLWVAIAVCLLAVVVVAAVLLLNRPEPVTNAPEMKLYWNVDGRSFMEKSSSGLTTRRKVGGVFTVRFLYDGEYVEYKVKDSRLMNTIDNMELLGLVFDEEGIVVEAVPVQKTGFTHKAPYYYIMSVEADKLVLNSAQNGTGMSVELPIAADTPVYDVSLMVERPGQKGTLEAGDRVIDVHTPDGKLKEIFLVHKNGVYSADMSFCVHCQKMVSWQDWTAMDALPKNVGHWKLTGQINLKVQQQIAADQDVVLDLNGYDIFGPENYRTYTLFNRGSSLALMDNSEEGSGRIITSGKYNGAGMAIWGRYGTFKMYGGTIDCSNAKSTANGMAVAMDNNTLFEMYGGTIIGGTQYTDYNANGKLVLASGASVYVAQNSVFNMYGGTIKNGYTTEFIDKGVVKGGNAGNVYIGLNSVMNMTGGEILDGKADVAGGNVVLSGVGSVLNMSGGTISGGRTTQIGRNSGNIHIGTGAVMNYTGGTIKNGTATGNGGNITVYGTLNMSAGTVSGGKIITGATMASAKEVLRSSANVYVRNGVLNMTGGEIAGYISASSTAGLNSKGQPYVTKVYMEGAPKISGGKMNLSLGSGVAIDLGTLTQGADIRMTTGGFVTSKTTKANAKYIRYDNEKLVPTQFVDSKVLLGEFRCICGNDKHIGKCNGEKLVYSPFVDSQLPATSGNYYLVADIKDAIQAIPAADAVINLDLNGYTIYIGANPGAIGAGKSYNYYRAFLMNNAGATVNLSDSVGGGRIVSGKRTDSGSLINCSTDCTINIYGGILDGSNHSETCTGVKNPAMSGATIFMGQGKLNMYGGTVIGTKGITLYNMKDNTKRTDVELIVRGGAIYCAKVVPFTMAGGTITGGTALGTASSGGGNVYALGEFTMLQGNNSEAPVIEKGESSSGGNVYTSGNVVNISGGVIADGVATDYAGGLYVNAGAKLTITGGEFYGGTAGISGNNIFVGGNANGSVSITGGKIYGGLHTTGNTVSVGGSAKVLDVNKQGTKVSSITLGTGRYITLLPLNTDADIKFDGTGKVAVFGDGAYSTYNNQLGVGALTLQSNPNSEVLADSTNVSIGILMEACLCGQTPCIGECDGIVRTWMPTSSLPTTAGNYYLTGDVTGWSMVTLADGQTINLNLNGYTIKRNGDNRIYKVTDGTLNIVDHVGSGGVVCGSCPNGGILYAAGANAAINIYGGSFDGSAYDNTTDNGNGGVAYIASGATLNIYGGTFAGGNVKYGGTIYVNNGGNLLVDGGEISGGTAVLGGNSIFVGGNANGSVSITGGTVYGGIHTTGKTVSVGGSAKILDENKQGTKVTGITLGAGQYVTVLPMTADADIKFDGNGSVAVFGSGAYSTYTDQISIGGLTLQENPNNQIVADASGISIGTSLAACLCGQMTCIGECNGTLLTWMPTSSLPTTAGNYYLTGDVTGWSMVTLSDGGTINLNLNGHTIQRNGDNRIYKVTDGTLNIVDHVGSGGVICGSCPNGGILYAAGANAAINLYGGTFNGSAFNNTTDTGNAAVVYLGSNATLNIYGGTLMGGTTKYGGAIYANGGAKVTMTGGEIYGGTATTGGNNIFVGGNANGSVSITGGTVYGGIHTTGKTVSVGGSAKILDENKQGTKVTGITLGAGQYVTLLPMTADADIKFDGSGAVAVFGDGAYSTYTDQISVGALTLQDNATSEIVADASGVSIVASVQACLCGQMTCIGECNGAMLTWMPTSSLPTTAGNYYLTGDVTGWSMVTLSDGGTINLNLNGHTIQRNGDNRIYKVTDGTLNIVDHVGGGGVIGGNCPGGGILHASGANAVINIYGGILNGSAYGSGASLSSGGVASIATDATLNIYGGTLIGGEATHGGAIYVNNGGNLLVNGGEIYGGTATTNGDNIYCGSTASTATTNTAKMTFTGGTVYGGVATAINEAVTLGDSAKILDTLKDGGSAGYGLKLLNTKQMTVKALNADADVRISPTRSYVATFATGAADTVSGQIKLDAAAAAAHSNYALAKDETGLYVQVTACICGKSDNHAPGCTELAWKPWISTNSLPTQSGNYYLTGSVSGWSMMTLDQGQSVNLDLNGYTINKNGNNRFCKITNGTLNITDLAGGGRIVGGNCPNGGILYASGANAAISIYGGIFDGSAYDSTGLEGSSAASDGGVAYIGGSASLTIHGGTFIGGDARYGGTIYVNGSANQTTSFTMTGGMVYGGTATTGGDNIFVGSRATTQVSITGGSIYGGQNISAITTTGAPVEIGGSAKVLDYVGPADSTAAYGIKLANATHWSKITVLALNDDADIRMDREYAENPANSVGAWKDTDASASFAGQLSIGQKTIDAAGEELFITRDLTVAKCSVSMYYDDFLDLTAAPYYVGNSSTVNITNQAVTSKQVANGELDEAVVTYDASTKTLYAAGVGTAKLNIDGTEFSVTVTAAPIRMFLIGGHSVSAGVGGNPEWSVVSRPGQVYSTYESYINTKVNANWGWEYNWSFSETEASGLTGMGIGHNAARRPETIDALCEGGTGTYGSGTALAHFWNQLTGEKVWILNAGHGGMALTEWKEGAVDFVHASKLFKNAQAVMKNEIAAGHFELKSMEFFYFSCANGDQTWYTSDYKTDFESMWNGFKREFTTDMNGDGTPETMSNIGLVPHWRPGGSAYVNQKFDTGHSYNYFMAASAAYPDVYIASSLCRGFDQNHVSATELPKFYIDAAMNYETAGGVDPKTLIPDTFKIDAESVFPDQIHVGQITQNLQGYYMAQNLYQYLFNDNQTVNLTVYGPNGVETLANNQNITVYTNETYSMSIMLGAATNANYTVEATGAVTVNGTQITAGNATGSGTVVIKDGSTVVHTIDVTVAEDASRHIHCVCGGATIENHTCDSNVVWKAWTSTTTLPTESGYYYLTADVNMNSYANILNGNKVTLCLNGRTITKKSAGILWELKNASQLTVCDCQGGGKMVGNVTNNYGVIKLLENAKLNWFGGSLERDAANLDSTTASGGLVYASAGAQINMYGGAMSGGEATNGGNIFLAKEKTGYSGAVLNLYGGTISGGTATTQGGNVYVEGTGAEINMYGGTISGGTAVDGGNVMLPAGAELNMSGGTISGGQAIDTINNVNLGYGGNIYVKGVAVITGNARIENGYATDNGGNAHIASAGNFTMNGAGVVITGGTKGNNVSNNLNALTGTDRTITLTQGTLGTDVYPKS